MASTSKLLNQLAEIRAEIERVSAPLLAKIEERTVELKMEAEALEEQIRENVLKIKTSVRGKSLIAVHMNRVSWDTRGLEGYGAAHPEILGFRKESQSVQIRRKPLDGNGKTGEVA